MIDRMLYSLKVNVHNVAVVSFAPYLNAIPSKTY